jgi:hypothetical protein
VDLDVDDVVGFVILERRYSRGQDSKYAKIVDLEWHVKDKIDCNIGKELSKEIPIQVEKRYYALFNAILGTNERHCDEVTHVEDVAANEGTTEDVFVTKVKIPSNLINLDFDH